MAISKTLRSTISRVCMGIIFCIALATSAQAYQGQSNGKTPITQQDYSNQEIEMADAWRANGKIYVVVATLSALMGGIAFYLVILDRKVSKLEKELKEE